MPQVNSLKEKRRILKSLMTRLKNDFNIAVAEVDLNDTLRRAVIGISTVSNSSRFSHQVISKVIDRVSANTEVIVEDYQMETY